MKTIIDGKKYNTETAQEIKHYRSNYSTTDFNWYEETLYRKKTGEFFLAGEGNAASKYSRSCGSNSYCGGEDIIPLPLDEAKLWVEAHCDVETYETLFGECPE